MEILGIRNQGLALWLLNGLWGPLGFTVVDQFCAVMVELGLGGDHRPKSRMCEAEGGVAI